jgi:hypothetical protein
MLIFIVLIPWLLFTVVVAALGADREIGALRAFFISLFLSPLIGAIFVATSPKVQYQKQLPPKVIQLVNSGLRKYRSKDFEGAKADYLEVTTLTPSAPNSHFMLAAIYSLQQNKVESFRHLAKAVEQGFVDFQQIKSSPSFQFLRTQAEFTQFAQNGYKLSQPSARSDDLVSQIERLGNLRQQGLLTEDEFQAQKKKLLDN